MALALGVRKNDRIYIGNEILTVLAVDFWHGTRSISVEYQGRHFEFDDANFQEIAADVQVSCDFGGNQSNTRLLFDAPRAIPILREAIVERQSNYC